MSPGKNSKSQIVGSLWAVVLPVDEVLVIVAAVLVVGDEVIGLFIPVDPVAPDGM